MPNFWSLSRPLRFRARFYGTMTPRPSLRVLPLAVLLLSAALSSQARDAPLHNGRLAPRKEPQAEPDPSLPISPALLDGKSSRLDVGTKDAPVDGMDGKPHAGPFVPDPVDPLRSPPESARKVKGSDNLKVPEAITADGVMNDPNRLPPKKGTTGTEGGVSEKDRDRLIHEFSTGEKMVQTPDSPKAATPNADLERDGETGSTPGKAAKADDKSAVSSGETVKGVAGLEVCLLSLPVRARTDIEVAETSRSPRQASQYPPSRAGREGFRLGVRRAVYNCHIHER